jgi:23S rRNA pseudouridine1911/1915/1917 synthase
MSVLSKSGKSSLTFYKCKKIWTIKKNITVSQLDIKLGTGRTHQIRVHCQYKGFPLIGDPLYGKHRESRLEDCYLSCFSRQALHAYRLSFIHPKTKESMSFQSPYPEDIKDLIFHLDHSFPSNHHE